MYNFKRIAALMIVAMLLIPACASAAAKKWPPEGEFRHAMEEKRKAEGIDGTTASPYLVDELYLGYHRIDFWVCNGDGSHIKFYENLTRNEDKAITLTLTADAARMEGVRMRFDDQALRTIARGGISEIVLCNKNGTEYAAYNVGELRALYKSFGLMPYDLLAVGAADEGILKLAEGGKFVDIEL